MDGGGTRLGDAVSEPTIAVEGLSFAYPDGTAALHDIDLHIHPGERIALLGPNGAGKTTLILHMNGIHLPQQGTVHVSGLPLSRDTVMEIRRRVGVVFQDPDDQLFMPTVWEDVAFGPQNLGLEGADLDARVRAALDAVEVGDLAGRPPNHLSFGQKRRVAIAGVLAMEPQILVFDEPTSNLDPATRRELSGLLRGLDLTQLIVTHDLPYALELCERSLIIDQGRIVADGPTRHLLGDPALLRAHRLELPFGFDNSLVG
jgi:cobalt/nickel transport system ATP-binding protein